MVVFVIWCALLAVCFAVSLVAIWAHRIDIDIEYAIARKNRHRTTAERVPIKPPSVVLNPDQTIGLIIYPR